MGAGLREHHPRGLNVASKPADVRFYFDADILGLAKVIAGLRDDCTYPGDPGATIHRRSRPACAITHPRTPDTVWLPEVTLRGWLIITRDSQIRETPAELAAVRSSGARMVALSGADAANKWAQLEVLMTRWRSIDGLLIQPGPFIYLATRTRLTRVSL